MCLVKCMTIHYFLCMDDEETERGEVMQVSSRHWWDRGSEYGALGR